MSSLCDPSLDSPHYVHVYFVLQDLELDTMLQMWPHQQWAEGKRITSLDLLVILCPMQPRIPLAFFAARAQYWLEFNSVSTRTLSGPLLLSCFPDGCPQYVLVPGVVPPCWQDSSPPLVELHEVSVSPPLQPILVPLDDCLAHWCDGRSL